MGLDFDIYQFCKKLRQSKPPYDCPVQTCDKVYKSICGLQYHLYNFNHDGEQSNPPSNSAPARKKSKTPRADGARPKFPTTPDAAGSPVREGLTYAEAQKMVEIDVGGRIQRINICDTLEIMSKDEFDRSVAAGLADCGRLDSAMKMSCTSLGSIGGISSIMVPQSMSSSVGDDRGGKLPEPTFRCIENYDIPDAPERPNSYIRFIERSPDELDAEVEYDMDEEDVAWLNIINNQREANSLPPVSMETFELLMDRFEKESYFEVDVSRTFQMQTNGKDAGAVIDDDAVCCICMDGECQNSNVILFCDMCNLAVHQDCYGVPYIPEGQWWCRRCLQSPSRAVDCVLCPNNGGAFKQTDQGHWAHVVCALWIPEVRFANTVFLEPIDSIETIPPARWKLTCYICKQRGVGACIQCHKTNCYAAFHVTCAQQAGLFMKMDTVRDSNGLMTSGLQGESTVLVQKTAFCDLHTPPDSEARPRVREKGDAKEESRLKMKKARKILAQKRSSIPVISIPTIPPERIIEIAMLVDMPQRNYFIKRLISYWTLKRQNRNGVPLLRRLQATHQARPDERPVGEKVASKSELCQQLKYWQCLRQDLERARLLCELVRKREKLKKEYVKMKERTLEYELHPLVCFLRRVLEMIQSRDAGEIFSEPVDPGEVPDYGDVVKRPMDLSTMRQKLESFHYKDLDEFEADFSLMLHNCMAYNSKETVFYRAAVKMRDQGGAILRQARRDLDNIGFDPESGIMLPERPRPNGQTADDRIVEEVDRVLNSEERKSLSPQANLTKLLELLDKCQKLHHGILRAKRSRYIKKEITKIRRRLAFERSGSIPGRKVGKTLPKEPMVITPRGRHRSLTKPLAITTPNYKVIKSPRRKSTEASSDVQMKSEDGFESDTEHEDTSGEGENMNASIISTKEEEDEEEEEEQAAKEEEEEMEVAEEKVEGVEEEDEEGPTPLKAEAEVPSASATTPVANGGEGVVAAGPKRKGRRKLNRKVEEGDPPALVGANVAVPTPLPPPVEEIKEEEPTLKEPPPNKRSSTSGIPYQTRKSALQQQLAEAAALVASDNMHSGDTRGSRRQSTRRQSVSTPAAITPRSRRGVAAVTPGSSTEAAKTTPAVTRSGREVKEPIGKPVPRLIKGNKTSTPKAGVAPVTPKVPSEQEKEEQPSPLVSPRLSRGENNTSVDESELPKRGRRKKIPKRQWDDDVSSPRPQGEPVAAKVSAVQRRSSSQQQLTGTTSTPDMRKSPLRPRQPTPDNSSPQVAGNTRLQAPSAQPLPPSNSQPSQAASKGNATSTLKTPGVGGKPTSSAGKGTPVAGKPTSSQSSTTKPLGSALLLNSSTTSPSSTTAASPLSSPMLTTPTKSSAAAPGESPALPLTQSQQQQQVSSGGSTGSPSGVNRRTAVLFTRKAAAAAFRKPDVPTPAAPKRRVGRPRKNLDAALGSVGTNAVLSSSNPLLMSSGPQLGGIGDANVKSQGQSKGSATLGGSATSSPQLSSNTNAADPASSPIIAPLPFSESFRVYRSGGDIPAETDEDSQSDSSSSSCSSSGSSSGSGDEGAGSSGAEEDDDDERMGPHGRSRHRPPSESSADEGAGGGRGGEGGSGGPTSSSHRHALVPGQQLSCGVVPLKPLDLVWAKCRGYPWYPALIIDPKMPKTGILHNGVPIPAAPADVLALSLNYSEPVFLVLFFDTKRTWQWLPRNKLEPLGMSTELDESKLTESRKPTERKAVRKAFQEAMQYQCQVNGQSAGTSFGSQVSLQPLTASVPVTNSVSSLSHPPSQASVTL
ncbi:bromodomain-containing protein homolog isoform X2 [Hetaerina americana]|uniref:bromodomain-containing protein homolog isoform X2 n=1 Tax=Hetaerina americana TaxID=62018 RepID=UPI003A7F189B